MNAPSPLHLYVHIPFCIHKCHYCDFNSHERSQPEWENYRLALIQELQGWLDRPEFHDRKLESLFFGGGTPSLAPPELIASVLDSAATLAGFVDGAEISLEANPGTVDAGHFASYRQSGVNRLSIGVQSLNARELEWLERIHSREQAIAAFETARMAGFGNINLDLMYALPGQSPDTWFRTLQQAVALGPEHLSCYQLTIEPHTRLAANPCKLPDDTASLAMFTETRKRLSDAGYKAYEISNFAREGMQCRHNDAYWRYHDYIGIGAGASGKWDMRNGGTTRYSNLRSPDAYIRSVTDKRHAVNSQETLEQEHAAAEAFWLGLRRSGGIQRHRYRQRFGFDAWERFHEQLLPWQQQEKLIVSDASIRLSQQGVAMADAVAASVL